MDAYYNQHKSLDASGCGNNCGLALPRPPDKYGNHMRLVSLCIRLARVIQDHNWTLSQNTLKGAPLQHMTKTW